MPRLKEATLRRAIRQMGEANTEAHKEIVALRARLAAAEKVCACLAGELRITGTISRALAAWRKTRGGSGGR